MNLQDFQLLPSGECLFFWSDHHRSLFSAKELRLACPCAACVDEWTREIKISESQIQPNLKIQSANKVGRYAVQFQFSDGHGTGIFSDQQLRSLCRCNLCHDSQQKFPSEPPCKDWVQ